VTCEDVRERLPEHLLGTLESDEDLVVRRHLRGCAACRAELEALAEGLTQFARAAHDRVPPEDLRGRVLTVLEEEWRDAPSPSRGKRWQALVAVAAALAVVVASLAWGVAANDRANVAAEDASSYVHLLELLGGREFRIGAIESEAGAQPVEGSAVLYDSHLDQSWAVVLVQAPGMHGTATATLEAGDGRTIEVGELEFADDGDAATWFVTSGTLSPYDRLTLWLPDGSVLASADIETA
jgi:predicted anti-sigma-YlaC factor YlaD